MLSNRIKTLHEKAIHAQPTVSLDRARLVTEFYRKPSVEPFMLRKAYAFEYILMNKQIYIDDEAILVGNHGSRLRSVPVYPENTAWLADEVELIDTRSADPYQFLPGEKEELRRIKRKERLFKLSPTMSEKLFCQMKEEMNLNNKYTIHSLRHTFITTCQEKLIPLHVIQSWVGHVIGSKVTTGVYTHKRETELEYINNINE